MADDQDQRELDAASTQRLVQAGMWRDIADNVMQVSGDDDVSLDQLSQADRLAYAATHASIARAHTAVALVQSHEALKQQLRELTRTIAFGQAHSSGQWG
jgi:hypothetical protein